MWLHSSSSVVQTKILYHRTYRLRDSCGMISKEKTSENRHQKRSYDFIVFIVATKGARYVLSPKRPRTTRPPSPFSISMSKKTLCVTFSRSLLHFTEQSEVRIETFRMKRIFSIINFHPTERIGWGRMVRHAPPTVIIMPSCVSTTKIHLEILFTHPSALTMLKRATKARKEESKNFMVSE